MKNTDRVVDYILKNVKELDEAKIRAMADVIKSLGGEVEQVPNDMPEAEVDPNLLDEEAPIDLSKIKNITVDGKDQPIKIYKN